MSEFNIALIPGDGIGPEIVNGAVTVLDAIAKNIIINLIIQKYIWVVVPLINMVCRFPMKQ